MNDTTILITAANGHTGLPAAKELLKLGFKVRAMVRNPRGKGAIELEKLGAEIFIGDMNDVRDYRKALKGVQRAYFCSPFSINTLIKTVAFVVAAEEAELEHVVYMSQWLLSEDHPSINTKEQWLGIQVAKMHTNVAYTFVNPGMFGFTYFLTVEMMAQLGVMPTAVKGAATSNIGLNAPPSEDDQGRVIAHILKDPSKHAGKTYRPTGPKLISQKDAAEIFGKIFGRNIKLMEVSENMLLKALKSYGYPVYQYSNIRYYVKDLESNTFAIGGGVTNVVRDITGREPEDFETLARRALADMPEAKKTLWNTIKAFKNFFRMLMTKTPDVVTYECEQNFPRFMRGMRLSKQNENWVVAHENQSNN